jgi:hypothetical protein
MIPTGADAITRCYCSSRVGVWRGVPGRSWVKLRQAPRWVVFLKVRLALEAHALPVRAKVHAQDCEASGQCGIKDRCVSQ